MKRVLALSLFVPFVMTLAPPCHAAGNGEVTVSLVDIPAELQERSVLITLGHCRRAPITAMPLFNTTP